MNVPWPVRVLLSAIAARALNASGIMIGSGLKSLFAILERGVYGAFHLVS